MTPGPGGFPAAPGRDRRTRPGTPRSLHPWRGPPAIPNAGAWDRPKPDRILVGLLAGVALFYLLGQALGLGRGHQSHADP